MFAGTLIAKLNQVTARNRAIQRNLQSVSAQWNRRFMVTNRSKSRTEDCDKSVNKAAFDCLQPCQEDLIPQQLWDDLFDTAIDAIGNFPIDIFDEK